jgi:hypothetical protein
VAAESTVDISTVLDTPINGLVCRHATAESVVQAVVAQPVPPTETDGVLSMGTKFKPSRVMEAAAVAGRLGVRTAVTAGESYENSGIEVPTIADTVAVNLKPLK